MAVPRRGAVEKFVRFVDIHLLIQIKTTRALRSNKVNKLREDDMSSAKPTSDPLLVLVGPENLDLTQADGVVPLTVYTRT